MIVTLHCPIHYDSLLKGAHYPWFLVVWRRTKGHPLPAAQCGATCSVLKDAHESTSHYIAASYTRRPAACCPLGCGIVLKDTHCPLPLEVQRFKEAVLQCAAICSVVVCYGLPIAPYTIGCPLPTTPCSAAVH